MSKDSYKNHGCLSCYAQHFVPGVTVSFFPSQFFPRGKNGPAHSFPGEKTDRSVFSLGERFD